MVTNKLKIRVNERQRLRRSMLLRIDFQNVAPDVKDILDGLTNDRVGGDYSSVLNRIVRDWYEHC